MRSAIENHQKKKKKGGALAKGGTTLQYQFLLGKTRMIFFHVSKASQFTQVKYKNVGQCF